MFSRLVRNPTELRRRRAGERARVGPTGGTPASGAARPVCLRGLSSYTGAEASGRRAGVDPTGVCCDA